jgi:hypothetical protein
MDLFKIFIFIAVLLFIFGLIPFLIFFYHHPPNKNIMIKINLKRKLISYYNKLILVSLIIFIITLFLYMKTNIININNPQSTQTPKIETQDEWFETKSKWEHENYIGPYRIDYSEENKEKIKTIKSSEIKLELVETDGSKTQIEGTPMIQRTYIFYGLDGIGRGQYPEHEPTDLAPFIKSPFTKWHDPQHVLREPFEYFDYFRPKHKNESSQFNNLLIPSPSNHNIYLNYKGAKYLLEEDKDFFMDEVQCPTKEKNDNGIFMCKPYYLHFNPQKKYITIYNQKHNIKI